MMMSAVLLVTHIYFPRASLTHPLRKHGEVHVVAWIAWMAVKGSGFDQSSGIPVVSAADTHGTGAGRMTARKVEHL
jgi:hypothetical protein